MAKIRVTQQKITVGVENTDNIRLIRQKVDVGVKAGNIRLTRQRINVGVIGGKLKLTRQRLLLLTVIDPDRHTSSNSLVFSQLAENELITDRYFGGNLLQLVQTLNRNIILNVTTSLNLTFDTDSTTAQTTDKSASNTLNFEQNLLHKKALPTKTASNTLNFTSETLGGFRLTVNTLLLTHLAEAEIFQLTGSGSNNIVFSQIVSLAESVFNRSASNQKLLTYEVSYNAIFTREISNQLLCNQLAFGLVIPTKKYVLLQAPFDCLQTSIVLPAPLFGDTESLISNVNIKRSMNGNTYSYVKSSNSRVLKYTFRMTRGKALEFQRFCEFYNSTQIKLQDWKGEIWKVNIMTNPIDFVLTGRDAPTEDRTDVNIEFEGVRING